MPPAPYSTGRFSGGTNYIDTLGQLTNSSIENFAIGGALTNNTNTNGVGLPGFITEWNAFLAGGGGPFPTVSGSFDENDLLAISVGGNDARFYQQTGGTLAGAPAAADGFGGIRDGRSQRTSHRRRAEHQFPGRRYVTAARGAVSGTRRRRPRSAVHFRRRSTTR